MNIAQELYRYQPMKLLYLQLWKDSSVEAELISLGNLEFYNRRLSQFFPTLAYTPTTIVGAQFWLLDDCPPLMQFGERLQRRNKKPNFIKEKSEEL